MDVKELFRTRVHAASPIQDLETIPLSIVDATCADLSTCGAVFFFNSQSRPPLITEFQQSLSQTLTFYPQWCGKVEFIKHEHPTTNHRKRHGRLTVTYGSNSDPGVEFVHASSSKSLADLIPSIEERRAKLRAWNTSNLDSSDLLPKTRLAPRSTETNAPCMICQVTSLACGSTAIAAGITHSMSDAQGLSTFMKSWSQVHKNFMENTLSKVLQPIFAPHLIDNAAGDIDTATPTPELIAKARSLPCNRYDTQIDSGGPSWSVRKTPDGIDHSSLSPGKSQPFEDWDLTKPVSSYLLHFSGKELTAIWEAASRSGSVSRHDALLAFIWILINRARFPTGVKDEEDLVHLDVSLGLRTRSNPPLPHEFLGSPIMVANVELPASQFLSQTQEILLVSVAQKIRSTLSLFNVESIKALLHDAAHEPCAQRLWQSFLGTKHTILTSWIHLGLYAVDFGIGDLRFVQPVLLSFDGIVEIMEAKSLKTDSSRHWTDGGVDVYIFLESDAMDRMLKDPLLRAYDK